MHDYHALHSHSTHLHSTNPTHPLTHSTDSHSTHPPPPAVVRMAAGAQHELDRAQVVGLVPRVTVRVRLYIYIKVRV